MGRIKQGILDGFSGTVGTVIGGNWRGVQYMRGKSFNRKNSNSPAQLEQRAKFALALKFSRTMNDLFEISYRDFTSEMTGANNAHSLIMKTAIKGVFPDFFIDYSQVLIAKGSLANAAATSATASSPETITFNWTHIPGVSRVNEREKDKTILVAYSEPLNLAVYTIGAATRVSGTAILHLPGFAGQDVHTWFAFLGQNGREIANSVYTGKVTVL